MAYLNLSAANKNHRAARIVTDLGATAYLMLYSGAAPVSPDVPVSAGALLAALPLAGTPGTVYYAVQSASIVNGGSGGVNGGSQSIAGTTGTGTKFTALVTVAGGAITAINSISLAGQYTALPSNLAAEPVTGASLTGATLALNVTATAVLSVSGANATASGTSGFARLATANTAGAAGIVDLDTGLSGSGAFVILNSTAITLGGPVSVTSAAITEA